MRRIVSTLTARKVAIGFVILGAFLLLIGYYCESNFGLRDNVLDLSRSIGLELLSIAASVLIIDFLVEFRQEQELRARLIRELGSRVNSVAVTAAVELSAHKWLEDGSVAKAYLRRANLHGADLKGADFTEATMRRAILRKSKLYRAKLNKADLRGVDLSNAYVGNTEDKEEGADLTEADFYRADLSKSDFYMSDFYRAKLDKSRLHGAKLKDTRNLNSATLTGALYDKETTWPEGFDPQKSEAILAFGDPDSVGPRSPDGALTRPP